MKTTLKACQQIIHAWHLQSNAHSQQYTAKNVQGEKKAPDIRMRSNGFRQLVDHKPLASRPRSFVKKLQ